MQEIEFWFSIGSTYTYLTDYFSMVVKRRKQMNAGGRSDRNLTG